MVENSTLLDLSSSVITPVRTRTVVNVIYIAGIAFMIGVFLLLLWVNLFSRHCWCWHDTSVVHQLNQRLLMRRSLNQTNENSQSKNRQQRRSSMDDDLA